MNKIIFVFLFITFNSGCMASHLFRERYVRIVRFLGFCEGHENLPMGLFNVTVEYKHKTAMIGFKIVVHKELNNTIKMVLKPIRCRNSDSRDTCEIFRTITFKNYCDIFTQKGIWTNFVQATEPPLRCPIKPGIYVQKQSSLDVKLMFFPIEGWFWITEVQGFDTVTKEQVFCYHIEAEII